MSLSWMKDREWLQMKEEVQQWGSELIAVLLSSFKIFGGFTPLHLMNNQTLMQKLLTKVTGPLYQRWPSLSLFTTDTSISPCLELLMEPEGTVLQQMWEGTSSQHPISLEHVLHMLTFLSRVSDLSATHMNKLNDLFSTDLRIYYSVYLSCWSKL